MAAEAGVRHHGAGAHQRVGAAKAGVDKNASGRVGDIVGVEVVVEEAELRDDPNTVSKGASKPVKIKAILGHSSWSNAWTCRYLPRRHVVVVDR